MNLNDQFMEEWEARKGEITGSNLKQEGVLGEGMINLWRDGMR